MIAPRIEDTLWATFASHAKAIPEVKAILAPDREPLLFRDLPARMMEIRDALNGFGIGRGDIVVGVLPGGPETAVCIVGVAACAAYFPLDPDLTEGELTRYLRRINPKAVIMAEGEAQPARRAADGLGIMTIDLIARTDQPSGTFKLESYQSAQCELPGWGTEADTALYNATSGTTSDHKLIPRKQRHMIAQARTAVTHYRFTTADLGLLIMPLFHGHGMEQRLTVPLLTGSGVVCPPVFDIPTFFENLARFRPTWYSAGFSHHGAILDAAGDYPKIVGNHNLRYMRSGSGRLDPRVIGGLETAFGVPVLEGLAMSEVPCVTCNPLPPAKRKPGTVGIALDGDVEIMDDHGHLLGPNSEGQIVVRGSMVFEGYLDDPEATAAALVDGWYHTGDLGCLDDEGYLTVVGRIKEFINRGGEKIRPGEVEVALMQHSDIKEAAAFPFPHPTLGAIVGAAIVPVTGTAPDRKDLMRFLADKLAPYKIPRDFTVLKTLPKGRTGKIDRTALTRMHTTPVKIPA